MSCSAEQFLFCTIGVADRRACRQDVSPRRRRARAKPARVAGLDEGVDGLRENRILCAGCDHFVGVAGEHGENFFRRGSAGGSENVRAGATAIFRSRGARPRRRFRDFVAEGSTGLCLKSF